MYGYARGSTSSRGRSRGRGTRPSARISLLCLEKMLDQGVYAAIATHDEYLVCGSVGLVERFRVPHDRYEFQMLLGVDEQLRQILLDGGHRLRVYVPYGPDWYPYSIRRLRENPEVAGHVARAFFGLSPVELDSAIRPPPGSRRPTGRATRTALLSRSVRSRARAARLHQSDPGATHHLVPSRWLQSACRGRCWILFSHPDLRVHSSSGRSDSTGRETPIYHSSGPVSVTMSWFARWEGVS